MVDNIEVQKKLYNINKKTFHVQCPHCGSSNTVKICQDFICCSILQKIKGYFKSECWNCKLFFFVYIDNGKVIISKYKDY